MAQEGEKIYVESLMSDKEYRETAQKFPQLFRRNTPYPFFECETKWRYRMGGSFNEDEIKVINSRLNELLKKVKK